jgi:hypothetical protein
MERPGFRGDIPERTDVIDTPMHSARGDRSKGHDGSWHIARLEIHYVEVDLVDCTKGRLRDTHVELVPVSCLQQHCTRSLQGRGNSLMCGTGVPIGVRRAWK